MSKVPKSEGYRASASLKNSLSYWYPIIKGHAPTPETVIVDLAFEDFWKYIDSGIPKSNLSPFIKAADSLGYPVFMRTSHASNKHDWENSCYVKDRSSIGGNLARLIEHDAMTSLYPDAIVFRKYIPMESYFTAFHGNFPVNKEMRCFIRNGKPECLHPYWFEDPIAQVAEYAPPSVADWKEKLKLVTTFSAEDYAEICSMLASVAPLFPDEYWSVDFAKGRDGKWYLIDMALGLVSYHWKGCPFEPEFVSEPVPVFVPVSVQDEEKGEKE